MPLLFIRHIALDSGQVRTFGVWQIAEDERYFREDLHLTPEEEEDLARYKGIRRLEWLAGRRLLHLLTGADVRLPLGKNAFAKPFFLHRPELHCSLSHSHGIVGAMLAEEVCGCDLQVLVDKMPRLAGKFLHRDEDSFLHTFPTTTRFDLLHVFWTAKESLYKAYGLKELDFRDHLRVEPFEWTGQSAETTGWVQKDNFRQAYRLHFEKTGLPDDTGAFVWTICVQNYSET
ncbi:MAG: 4'-phosphopantetheinyl transferase superfamily protein [Saprospiraceae bacterium]|jgi:4'-phosphopantetheinyl transferase|nr:4'-phosphopantetheinyl transferase superfamily protein [Saprospiraceae bacterium]